MPNYKRLYYKLLNAVTDAINELKQAQIDGEQEYITDNEDVFEILKSSEAGALTDDE